MAHHMLQRAGILEHYLSASDLTACGNSKWLACSEKLAPGISAQPYNGLPSLQEFKMPRFGLEAGIWTMRSERCARHKITKAFSSVGGLCWLISYILTHH